MSEILDAERVASRMGEPRPADPRQYLLAFFPDAEIAPLERRALHAEPLPARINHGQWIVSCDCRSRGLPAPGMAVWLTVPWAWCVRCRNRPCGGAWRPVCVPPESERVGIEAVLTARAESADRNWQPGETIDDLVRQNVEHGEPVPEGG